MPYLDHVVDANSLRVKRSDQPGEVPSAGSLRPGELAINITDRKLFIGGLSGEVTELDTELPSSSPNGAGLQYNGTSWVTTATDDDNGVFLKHPGHGAIAVVQSGAGVKITHAHIAFPDGSRQESASPYNISPNGSSSIVPAIGDSVINGSHAVIAGGRNNINHGNNSFVGGGEANNIGVSCDFCSIVGGNNNSISGSTAAGIFGAQSSFGGGCHHSYIVGYGINVGPSKPNTVFVNNLEIIQGSLIIGSIPTTNPNVAGKVWSDNGTLKISSGS